MVILLKQYYSSTNILLLIRPTYANPRICNRQYLDVDTPYCTQKTNVNKLIASRQKLVTHAHHARNISIN